MVLLLVAGNVLTDVIGELIRSRLFQYNLTYLGRLDISYYQYRSKWQQHEFWVVTTFQNYIINL